MRKIVVLLGLVAAVALAACGGGGDKTTTATTATTATEGLSKAELAAAATPICKKIIADIAKVPQPKDINDPAQATVYYDKVVPIAQAALAQLAALKGDESSDPAWRRFVNLQTRVVGGLDNVRKKAKAKDVSGLQDLQTLTSTNSQANAAAQAAGVPACAG